MNWLMITIRRRIKDGYTLIELLIVISIFLLLAAIALPNVRTLLSDQKNVRASRGISTFMDIARSRAISEGRLVGVQIERLNLTADGQAASIRLRQVLGTPPYRGDASDSVGVLRMNGTEAEFSPVNNPLLRLSASMTTDPTAPIRNGDLFELPGGRLVPITITPRALTEPDTVPIVISFNQRQVFDGVATFPMKIRTFSEQRPIPFRIHRTPIVSSSAPFDLPRGLVVDLNYSGMGLKENQFAPGSSLGPIQIVFAPDGTVSYVQDSSLIKLPPSGLIFLCLGDSDGVRSDDLFAQEKGGSANLLRLESSWLVINPSTGRITTSPMATVSTIPTSTIIDPTDDSLDVALKEARQLAIISETNGAN